MTATTPIIIIVIIIICLLGTILRYSKYKCVEMRLVEYGIGKRKWVTIDTYNKMVDERDCMAPGFLDVTFLENPDVVYYALVEERSMSYRMLRAVPKTPTQQALVKKLLQDVDMKRATNIITSMAKMNNRYAFSDTGVAASTFIHDYIQNIIKTHSAGDNVSVEYFNHRFTDQKGSTTKQKSIIAKIKGTSVASEIVIHCAHLDSINTANANARETARAPGADDNATGVSNVLEAFNVLVKNKIVPLRTVEFHLYAGEELGLKGSLEVAEKYKKDKKNVVAILNMDMTGYTKDGKTCYILSGDKDYVDAELADLSKLLIPMYTKLVPKEGKCGYACSDHASWSRFGYPTSCVSEGSPVDKNYNKEIHSANDTMKNVTMPYSIEFCKFGIGFIIETSMVK